MGAIGRTIRRYILWTYDRGTVHYDIMVTLILVFIFASPLYIKYDWAEADVAISIATKSIKGERNMATRAGSNRWKPSRKS